MTKTRRELGSVLIVGEAVAFGLEVGFYLVVLLVVVAVLRKCVCPLVKWTFKDGSSKKKQTSTAALV